LIYANILQGTDEEDKLSTSEIYLFKPVVDYSKAQFCLYFQMFCTEDISFKYLTHRLFWRCVRFKQTE